MRQQLFSDPYFNGVPSLQPDAWIHVRTMPAHQHVGLQLTDYCLRALQRLFTKGGDRFLGLIWPKVGLSVDADDRYAKHCNEESNVHRLRFDLEYFVNKTDRGDEKNDDDPQHDFKDSTGSMWTV
jgi:hypothetical protein